MTTLTVGTGQDYTTLSAAAAAANPGDTIDLQAGTYTNDFPAQINGLTIEGVGGIAKLVATDQPGNGKAILDVAGNTTLKNLDISGVTVPDANGAGIRYESGNLVVENTAIHGNQDGILGASDPNGSITIDQSEIYDNGTGTGSTHNIYIGDIAQFILTNSYIHDANTGHEVKSRAENNTITNNRIEDGSSTASYQIDLPNGGNAIISGNTIQKSANSGNHVTIAYGEEGNAHSGTAVNITGNTFVSDQSGSTVLWDASSAPISALGNSIYGYSQIDKAGNVSSSGFSVTSTRASLDTSSPINQSTPAPATNSTQPVDTATPAPPVPAPTPNPAPSFILALTGTGEANSTVILTDDVNGQTATVGSATTGADGGWSITTGTISTSDVNIFGLNATNNGTTTSSAGSLIVSSAGSDALSGTAGQGDVFAFFSYTGNDVINGFETTASAGANHDVIDLVDTAYHSFDQLQSQISGSSAAVISVSDGNTITLSNVNPNTLSATDFRFG